jgi:hypothetical protein
VVAPTTGPAGDDPAAVADGRRRRLARWSWVVAAAVVAAIVIVVLITMTDSDEQGYDDGVRARFLEVCTADGGEPVRSTCECLYEGVEREIPYDEFERIDAELAAQADQSEPGAPLDLPAEVQAILDRCLGGEPADS